MNFVQKIVLSLIGWLLLGFLSSGAMAKPVSVTDERGLTQTWPAPPQRVVSLLPSLTETVCALGACERLVGVDRYSNWPEAVRRLPVLGGGLDPQVEAVLALRPDVVFMARSSRAVDQLTALGLKVVVLEPHNLADVARVLKQVAQALGLDPQRAEEVVQRIDAAVAAQARMLPMAARGAKVYFEVNSAPYGAGEASFIGQLLTRLGARNILPASMGPFPKVNPEFVLRASPDLIMIGDQNFRGLGQRRGSAAMPALKRGAICVFGQAESDILVRPGPRMDEAVAILARCLTEKTAQP